MNEDVFIKYGIYQTDSGKFYFHDSSTNVGIYPFRVPERVGPFETPEKAIEEARRRRRQGG